jgi:hypothetical protein
VTRERNRYFTGRLLDAEDLNQEQEYLLEKARRHNRLLHGWGVVDGLGVEQGPGKNRVTIGPGYALDPHGEEIVVDQPVTVDLSARLRGKRLHVAVRYDERPSGPAPAPAGEEYTRVCETFAVEILARVPARSRLVFLAELELGPGGRIASIAAGRRRDLPG